MKVLTFFAVSLGLALFPLSNVQAQTPPAPAAPASPAAAPDVVMLNDGGILRGTIAELKPGQEVTIILLTGEKRTIPMSDVKYAGPDADRPKAAEPTPAPAPTPAAPAPEKPETASPGARTVKPFATVRAAEAPFRFRSSPDGVGLSIRSGSANVYTSKGSGVVDAYSDICTSPCEGTLPVGTHRLALAGEPGVAIEPDSPTRLDGPSDIDGQYLSRRGTRMAGWGVIAGSLVVGGVMILSSSKTEAECSGAGAYRSCFDKPKTDSTMLYGGMLVGLGGGVVGFILAFTPDKAVITVAPRTEVPSAPGSVSTQTALRSQLVPSGIDITGRF